MIQALVEYMLRCLTFIDLKRALESFSTEAVVEITISMKDQQDRIGGRARQLSDLPAAISLQAAHSSHSE